jgi:hypothetical protein
MRCGRVQADLQMGRVEANYGLLAAVLLDRVQDTQERNVVLWLSRKPRRPHISLQESSPDAKHSGRARPRILVLF